MATFTAQILIGQEHPCHGGITPTHTLFLFENSRPAWILSPAAIFPGSPPAQEDRVTWIPTLETTLEDGLLMLCLYVLKDSRVEAAAAELLEAGRAEPTELYRAVSRDELAHLHALCREVDMRCKLVVTVLAGSLLAGQLPALRHYRVKAEVCVPQPEQ
jgi:hypothetical protein